MARLFYAGGESADNTVEGTGADAGTTYVSTPVRSGVRAWQHDSGAGNVATSATLTLTGSTARDYYLRAYIRFPAAPGANIGVLRITRADTTQLIGAVLLTDRTVVLFDYVALATVGSASSALSVDTWYRIELRIRINTGSNDDTAELYIDGTQIASSTTRNLGTSAPGIWTWGWAAAPGANKLLYTDDVALNDDQGTQENTYPGAGSIALLMPVSDNSRTNWTAGAGGTTNLWDAVNNRPPAGLASAGETDTSNIESANNSGTANYVANLQTYSDAGMTATDHVRCLWPVLMHGEDIATGSKTGSFELTGNPVIAASTFTFGDDAGAHGAHLNLWKRKQGTLTYQPTVTITSNPTMKVTKTDTGTRTACVELMGLLVEWSPYSTQSLSGGITPAGSLANRVNKPLSGALTPAGALVNRANQALSGALTPAGALVQRVAKPLSGTVTSAGSLTNSFLASISLAGTITSAGSLVNRATLALSGTITSAGSLGHRVNLALSGAVTPAGSLVRRVQQALSGSVASAGALSQRVSQALSGTVPSAGTLSQQVRVNLVGTVTSAGTLVNRANKVLSGTVTSAGTLVHQVQVQLAGAVASAGGLVKQVAHHLAGAIATLTGALSNVFQPGGGVDVTVTPAALTLTLSVPAPTVTAAALVLVDAPVALTLTLWAPEVVLWNVWTTGTPGTATTSHGDGGSSTSLPSGVPGGTGSTVRLH